ncbi:ElyC/SanA/YdcF family protein [Pseudomonas umsongensis]|uniref:ElyC/SanA/YdcF family protein n=1 Tax=Pseudomonas umsongensis TaxID=198618 RepID=UPI003D7F6D6B
MISSVNGSSSSQSLERCSQPTGSTPVSKGLDKACQGKAELVLTKNNRLNQFTVPNGYILTSGRLITVARPYSNDSAAKPLEQTLANAKTILNTALTMRNLIKEGHELAELKPAGNSPQIELATRIQSSLGDATKGRLSVLTSPIALTVDNSKVTSLSPSKSDMAVWIKSHDTPGSYIVLNGNNDETYVSYIADKLADSKHINFITSGFGGHGTTDRHAIATNKTEGDRFKELLMEKGIAPQRITVDPFSTNSGQNAINVADIINRDIQDGKPLGSVIVSGTPAAVFRQTYTYAQQLKINSETPFQIESFPFCDEAKYTTLADNLAIIREFSTTLNYLFNTAYLPSNAGLYPEAFFSSVLDCLATFADKLTADHPKDADKHGTVVRAIRTIDQQMIERFKSTQLTSEDKMAVRTVDDFFRSLFNPLEHTFNRGTV